MSSVKKEPKIWINMELNFSHDIKITIHYPSAKLISINEFLKELICLFLKN